MQYKADHDVLDKFPDESSLGESIRKIKEANIEFLVGVQGMRDGYDKARAALDKILDLNVPMGLGRYVNLRNVMPNGDAAEAELSDEPSRE